MMPFQGIASLWYTKGMQMSFLFVVGASAPLNR